MSVRLLESCAQVLFLTIMAQLYAPLNSFSSNYRNVSSFFAHFGVLMLGSWRVLRTGCTRDAVRTKYGRFCWTKLDQWHALRRDKPSPVLQLQKGLIDMENMFELLERRSAVQDLPAAKPLTVSEGAPGMRVTCAPT